METKWNAINRKSGSSLIELKVCHFFHLLPCSFSLSLGSSLILGMNRCALIHYAYEYYIKFSECRFSRHRHKSILKQVFVSSIQTTIYAMKLKWNDCNLFYFHFHSFIKWCYADPHHWIDFIKLLRLRRTRTIPIFNSFLFYCHKKQNPYFFFGAVENKETSTMTSSFQIKYKHFLNDVVLL